MPAIYKEYDEKTSIEKCIYDSANVLASLYNEKTFEMTIIFYKERTQATGLGEAYTYLGVTPVDYVWFREQKSQGKILHEYIKKNGFKFVNNGKYQITDIIQEKMDVISGKKKMITENEEKPNTNQTTEEL